MTSNLGVKGPVSQRKQLAMGKKLTGKTNPNKGSSPKKK